MRVFLKHRIFFLTAIHLIGSIATAVNRINKPGNIIINGEALDNPVREMDISRPRAWKALFYYAIIRSKY